MLDPTPDLSAIAEQMCRIEHKLDLIITHLATHNGDFPLTTLAEGVDPITLEPVEYYMDLMKRHVVRKSADSTGLIAPSPVLFAPQSTSTTTTGSNNGGTEGSDTGG